MGVLPVYLLNSHLCCASSTAPTRWRARPVEQPSLPIWHWKGQVDRVYQYEILPIPVRNSCPQWRNLHTWSDKDRLQEGCSSIFPVKNSSYVCIFTRWYRMWWTGPWTIPFLSELRGDLQPRHRHLEGRTIPSHLFTHPPHQCLQHWSRGGQALPLWILQGGWSVHKFSILNLNQSHLNDLAVSL